MPYSLPITFNIQIILKTYLESSDFFEDKVVVNELLEYFVPRSMIDGEDDTRDYRERVNDMASKPVTLRQASIDPMKWGLDKALSDIPSVVKELNPFPVITDVTTGRSLIADSNHTLAMMVNSAKISAEQEIILLRHVTNDGSSVTPDFEIINRL